MDTTEKIIIQLNLISLSATDLCIHKHRSIYSLFQKCDRHIPLVEHGSSPPLLPPKLRSFSGTVRRDTSLLLPTEHLTPQYEEKELVAITLPLDHSARISYGTGLTGESPSKSPQLEETKHYSSKLGEISPQASLLAEPKDDSTTLSAMSSMAPPGVALGSSPHNRSFSLSTYPASAAALSAS